MFLTDSDTEVALHAYLEWGADFVEQIDGMFAIVIWDAKERKLRLLPRPPGHQASLLLLRRPPFRVRLGAQGAREGALPPRELEIDGSACYDFLGYRYVPAPKTLYKRCFKLPPAHELVYIADTGALCVAAPLLDHAHAGCAASSAARGDVRGATLTRSALPSQSR